jgi:hypothetical protein
MTADRPTTPPAYRRPGPPKKARPRTARFQCDNVRCRQVITLYDDGRVEGSPCGYCSSWDPQAPPSKIRGRLHRLEPGVRAKAKKRGPRTKPPATPEILK